MTDEQLAWEAQMADLGASRFLERQKDTANKGRYTETSAGNRIITSHLLHVSESIRDYLGGGSSRNAYRRLLLGIDPDKIALFALHRIVDCVYSPVGLQAVASKLGKMIEDDLRFGLFKEKTPEFYNAITRDLDSRNSVSYRHRHRVLVSQMNKAEVEWVSWSPQTQIGVGLLVLRIVQESTDLFEILPGQARANGGSTAMVKATETTEAWVLSHTDGMAGMLPDRLPCIVPPADWTDWKTGGFYSKRLRDLTPLVKLRGGQQRDGQKPLLDEADMPVVLESVNGMQNTGWAINTRVLEVAQEVWDRGLGVGMPQSTPYEFPDCPLDEGEKATALHGSRLEAFQEWKAEMACIHALEAERRAHVVSTARTLWLANELREHEHLWFVYQLDFRSRAYCTVTGVSPQGGDLAKGMLHFDTPKVLGKYGWFWLRVHGANKYGNDKGDYHERVQWVDENLHEFIAAARDPIGRSDVWKDADKPYQFLAWCFEIAEAVRAPGGPSWYASRIPVALDGSCNGLQHLSAMLRDPVGGAAVNLTPSPKPADIYRDVAQVATQKLLRYRQNPGSELHAVSANWLAVLEKVTGEPSLHRKITKSPVMTLPYGSTLQACTHVVYAWYLTNAKGMLPKGHEFKHACALAGIIWEAIGEVVVAAREAMKWLQQVARRLASVNAPLSYKTPIGFPVYQWSANYESTVVNAFIGGATQVRISQEIEGINPYKAANGSSPNVTHGTDATHEHMCVAAGVKAGITHFAMIHDDFGVHACHVQEWHGIIRREFERLHTENDILQDLLDAHSDLTALPQLPNKGNLDLSAVRKSLFFFG